MHTRDCHRRAEQSGVIREILARTISRAGYVCYLRDLHTVYAALERQLAPWHQHPTLGPLADPALCRATALVHDLEGMVGRDWQRDLPLTAAGHAYERRLDSASRPQLIAHAYVRYLGDLNGGRVMQRLLAESLALPSDCMAFYQFPAIDEPDRFQEIFRSAIDRGVTVDEIPLVLEEARLAFELNISLAEAALNHAA